MTGEVWYNIYVGVATHFSAISSDQGNYRTDLMGAAPFSMQEGAHRQSPVSLIAERGRAR